MSQTQDPEQLSGAYRWEPNQDESFIDENHDYHPNDDRLTTDETSEPAAEYESEGHVRDGSLFKQEIQRDPEICSSCFLPNYDVVVPHSPRPSADRALVRYYIPIESVTTSEPGAAETCKNPPRACQCGRLRSARYRPLDMDHVVEFATNLSHTLVRKQRERERRAAEADGAGADAEARKLRAEARRFGHDPLLLVVRARELKHKHPMSDDSNLATALHDARFSTAYSWGNALATPSALPEPTTDDRERFARHRTRTPTDDP